MKSPHGHHQPLFHVWALLLLCTSSSRIGECTKGGGHNNNEKRTPPAGVVEYSSAISCRKHTAYLTDFGGVGDGKTLNTGAFHRAVANLSRVAPDHGAMLIVPAGKWLTAPFYLTSHFTLYLHKDAVILGTQDESQYPLISPLPSYGRGRDAPGDRFTSLIFGTNLTDVVITGGNGTINGQGEVWWDKYRNKELKNTRPYLIEIMYSNQIQISNLTLLNSPSWVVHPVYSSDIIIEHLTILAPIDSENTDGIDPDSCANVRIWDNYIVSGDDCIAIKSGWDEYGIAFNMPTKQVSIKRLTCVSPFSATIALGSEMSGGIEDVRADDITAVNTESAVRIKTSPGRGGHVRDMYLANARFRTMKYVFWVTAEYGDHPDNRFNPNAVPTVQGINFRDVTAENVTVAGKLVGLKGRPFTGLCISNATIAMHVDESAAKTPKQAWNCTDVQGFQGAVTPKPCNQLVEKPHLECKFPRDKLPVENVQLKTCSLPLH
ncbi:unnamed protein product [Cuscuta campestris]|uniref:Pectate lyase superfamily protein domain-containing protein n=1 Tax=Cuscuta campestris TaxID=132261 RepID=A0A484KSV7_9ASTE|nr:unnamed protein product [Cuscuta campestris]